MFKYLIKINYIYICSAVFYIEFYLIQSNHIQAVRVTKKKQIKLFIKYVFVFNFFFLVHHAQSVNYKNPQLKKNE